MNLEVTNLERPARRAIESGDHTALVSRVYAYENQEPGEGEGADAAA